MEEWRTPERRHVMITKIAEAMRTYPGVVNSSTSPGYIEHTIYQKSKLEDEYIQGVKGTIQTIEYQGQLQQREQHDQLATTLGAGALRPSMMPSLPGSSSPSPSLTASQAAAEAVLRAAELSSRFPPGAQFSTTAGGGPSVWPGYRPNQPFLHSSISSSAPRPFMTPSFPGSGGQTLFSQPQGGMGAGEMRMYSGMPSGAIAPSPNTTAFMTPSVDSGMNQNIGAGGSGGFPFTGASMMSRGVSVTPSQPREQLHPVMFNPAAGGGHLQHMQQPIQQLMKVWSGFLETFELLANNQRQPRQTPCSMFVSHPDISLVIKPQLWPTKLTMSLRPRSILNAISAVAPINQNTVHVVRFQFIENVQNVPMLKTLMINHPMQMQKRVIGIVEVSGHPAAIQQCPVKAFIMVWAEKSRQFTGVIHLDQEKFIQALRQALTHIARMQQMAMQQQQHQMSMGQRGMQVGGQEQFQQQQQQQFNQPSSLMGMPMQQQQAQFSSMQSQQGAMQQAAGNQGQEFLEMQQSQEGIGASSSTPQNLGDMEAQQMGQQQRMSVEDLVDADATQEAFQQEVGVCISNLVVSGSPGSGKTSVVTLSVGEPAPDVRNSTGCVETPVRAIARGTICANGTKLQKLQTEEMLHKVCQAMRHKVDEIKSQQHVIEQLQHETPSAAITILTTDQLSTDCSLSMNNDVNQPFTDSSLMNDDVLISANPSEFSADQDEDLQVFSNLIAEISSVEASTEFLTAHLVLTIDSGGQPHFMDVAPLFLRNSSLFLLTVKLNERLDSKPKFNFFINGQAIEMSNTVLQPTNLQLIELLAKSISSLQLSTSTAPSDRSNSRHAKFMIVGTFADKAEDCQGESVADKNSILRDRLKDYEAERIDEGNDIILAINAITTDPDERQKAALRLQDKITNTPGTAIKTKIKLRWFGLLLYLLDEAEKQGVPIIPLEDVLAAGRCLQMTDNETREAIAFFHDLNLLMYFSTDKLGSIVFFDVKSILGNVSNLIGISFINKDKLKNMFSPNLPADAQRLLRDYGTFSREILDSSFHFSAPLTTDVFLNLLEHLCVITRIEKDGQISFFLPCALPHAPEDILREKEAIYAPWILLLQARRGTKLVDVPIPNGYLPTLAVHLLSSPEFEADLTIRQYRNLMSVLYVRGGRVYLIEKYLHLQIYFTWDNELTQDCFFIRSTILDALVKVEEKLHFIPDILIKKDAFLCSCDGSRQQHVCVYNAQSNRASCNRSEGPKQLNRQQLCWLMQPSEVSAVLCSMKDQAPVGSTSGLAPADLLNKPLKMRELMRKVASRATDKWEMIGLELDIEQHQLNTIAQSSHLNAIHRFSRVFKLWQNQADPPFTWSTIVGVLRSPIVGENSLAQEIEDWLREP